MGQDVLNLLGDDDFDEPAKIHPHESKADISEMPREIQWLMLNVRYTAIQRGPSARGYSYNSGGNWKTKARFGGKRNKKG